MEVNRRTEWPAMVGHTQCLDWNDHVKMLVKPHPRLVVRKILVCPSVLALTWILGVHHLVNSCFCKTGLALIWHQWWAYCFNCSSLCLGLMWWQSLFPFHVELSYLSAMQQKQWIQFHGSMHFLVNSTPQCGSLDCKDWHFRGFIPPLHWKPLERNICLQGTSNE